MAVSCKGLPEIGGTVGKVAATVFCRGMHTFGRREIGGGALASHPGPPETIVDVF